MAYYGKRKYSKSRKYSRRRRTLSTRSIYNNKGSRAQASQIASLNRKVSRVYRSCRPEIKYHFTVPNNFMFSSNVGGAVYHRQALTLPSEGSGNFDRVGDLINPISLQLYQYAEYYNSSTTGYHDSESSGGVLRVVVVQYKTVANEEPTPDEIIQGYSSTGTNYTLGGIFPLANNITQKFRVLLDYKRILTTDNNQVQFRKTVKPNKFRFTESGNSNPVYIFTFGFGLHYDSDFSEYIKCTTTAKLVYTDA